MQQIGNPLFESTTTLASGFIRDPDAEIHLEDMSARAMRCLEYVFKIAEEREGPLNYETFKSVLQAVLGHRVSKEVIKVIKQIKEERIKLVYNMIAGTKML